MGKFRVYPRTGPEEEWVAHGAHPPPTALTRSPMAGIAAHQKKNRPDREYNRLSLGGLASRLGEERT